MRSTTTQSLLGHQWAVYTQYHRSRHNLMVHIVAVPVFLAGNIGLIVSLARMEWIGVVLAMSAMMFSLAAQKRGHGLEPVPAEPFAGPCDAMVRLLAEQWITFPRFVLSGQWMEAFRATSGIAPPPQR